MVSPCLAAVACNSANVNGTFAFMLCISFELYGVNVNDSACVSPLVGCWRSRACPDRARLMQMVCKFATAYLC
jgi:hypothetical protein